MKMVSFIVCMLAIEEEAIVLWITLFYGTACRRLLLCNLIILYK